MAETKSYTVTQFVKAYKQPRGGFLNTKCFEQIQLEDVNNEQIIGEENVHASLVGLAVEYMTRFLTGTPQLIAFEVPSTGAYYSDKYFEFNSCINKIHGLDDESIANAIKIVGFDSITRAGLKAYKPIDTINPDKQTISNVRIMIKRSLNMFKNYGDKIADGIRFEGGYTDTIWNGDADFLTVNSLLDFKTIQRKINSKDTFQLLIYYILGIHSDICYAFDNIKYLAIYNPRKNILYRCEINKIPLETLNMISKEMGYSKNNSNSNK